ncbi:MAG: O-antigen ligase family protein, partial [Planctomycetota bacterium]
VVLRKVRWQWTGAEIGWLAMLLAAAISTMAASNQRLAINASSDWLTAMVMMMVLVNLCRDKTRITLVLAVIVASGAASATKCIMQTTIEYAETLEDYQRNKVEFWQKQGTPLDDPRVELYERRLKAREASGFIPHSNAQGALLSLAAFAALAIGAFFERTPAYKIIFLILALILFSTIYTTGSRMAMLAAGIGFGLWLLLKQIPDNYRRHWRTILATAWGLVILGTLIVVTVGVTQDKLPGSSLTFRWNYWQVTSRIIADNLWTGVGAQNFDRAYMAHKPIEFPEEINDPHNLLMAHLSQWGILGGIGLVLSLVGVSIVVLRTWGEQQNHNQSRSATITSVNLSAKLWIAALIMGFILLRIWLLGDYLFGGIAGRSFVLFDLGAYGMIWAVCLAGIILLVKDDDVVESEKYRLICLSGIVAFCLQNTIDYSMFYPGTLTPFMACLAILLARRQMSVTTPKQLTPALITCCLAVMGLIYICSMVVTPVTMSSHYLIKARKQSSMLSTDLDSYDFMSHLYRSAADADPIDPTPLAELATRRFQYVQLYHFDRAIFSPEMALHFLSEAVSDADQAIRRDGAQISLYRLKAWLLKTRFGLTGIKNDLRGAIESARQVHNLYPNSPDGHVGLAEILVLGAEQLPSVDLLSQARWHYQQALDLDAARPGTDEVRRWSLEKRQQILNRLKALELQSADRPTTTNSSIADQQ